MERSKGRRHSRSRSRDKRDRDESRERDRGRGDHRDTRDKTGDRDRIDRSDKGRSDKDRSDRDRDRERSERERASERDRDRSRSTRENDSVATSSRNAATSSSGTTTIAMGASSSSSSSSSGGGLKDKATIDKLRRERLELVKRLTQTEEETETAIISGGRRIIPQKDASGIVTFKNIEFKGTGEKGDNNEDGEGEEYDSSGEGDGDEENRGGAIEEVSEEDMLAMMGFSGFNTTKDKPHEDNLHSAAVGAVSKHKKRKYRQYMNRRGGFNRPLQYMQ